MSLIQLASMAKRSSTRNLNSTQTLADLPANLLETFIPGYSTIVQLVLETFSIDINTIVTISLFTFALGRSIGYLKDHLLSLLMQHGTCSIEISGSGDQYYWIMDWLAERGIGKNAPHQVAVAWYHKASLHNHHNAYLNPRPRTSARKLQREQRYEPAMAQTQYFWYKRHFFRWHRKTNNRVYPEPQIEALISCVSSSTAPIKDLIDTAKANYYAKRSQKTSIRRPSPRSERGTGGNVWKLVSSRPSRPLETVVLGKEQKDKILDDIKEYLLPTTREWYAERGIPYRRGYVRLH